MNRLLWQKLEEALQRQVAVFPAVAGIALKSLHDDQTLSIHGDEIFPTASTIKLHILTQLLLRAEQGEIDLHTPVKLDPQGFVGGSGVLCHLEGEVTLSLLDLAILMIIVSDNTATNLCLEVAGLEATNQLLQRMGLQQTHLRRKMMDHLAAVREQENVSTPAELVRMLELLHQGQPTPIVGRRALAILKKPKQSFLPRGLPASIAVANKPGWVENAMCDAGIVYLPRRPYVLAVMTKYGMCTTEQQEQFIVDVTKTVHATMAALDVSNQVGRAVY